MVDVATTWPPHPVPHDPPSAGQALQGKPDRSLRVGANTPPCGEALRPAYRPREAGAEQEEPESHQHVSPAPRSSQGGEQDQGGGERVDDASDEMTVLLTTRIAHGWREHTAASHELGPSVSLVAKLSQSSSNSHGRGRATPADECAQCDPDAERTMPAN
jgi:hypothetical protein